VIYCDCEYDEVVVKTRSRELFIVSFFLSVFESHLQARNDGEVVGQVPRPSKRAEGADHQSEKTV